LGAVWAAGASKKQILRCAQDDNFIGQDDNFIGKDDNFIGQGDNSISQDDNFIGKNFRGRTLERQASSIRFQAG
jgi:hypothetical protein